MNPKITKLLLLFVFSLFFTQLQAGHVVIFQQKNGKPIQASQVLSQKYQQLSNDLSRDIWVFFYDQIPSTDIAHHVRLTRNKLGLGKPHNVVVLGVAYKPKRKLFVDYFTDGVSDNIKGKELYDIIRADFKANRPEFATIANHSHALLKQHLFTKQKQQELAKEKELAEKQRLLLEEQKRLEEVKKAEQEKLEEAKKTEQLKREEAEKTEKLKREEIEKTEKAKREEMEKKAALERKLMEEEAERNEEPLEIPWKPIGQGTGGGVLLLSGLAFWRRRRKYREEKERLLDSSRKSYHRFVQLANNTKKLLDFEVVDNLGAMSVTEHSEDKKNVEVLAFKYYDYDSDVEYTQEEFNQYWFDNFVKEPIGFKPFKDQLGLTPLQTHLDSLKSDLSALQKISTKNRNFITNYAGVETLLQTINEKEKELRPLESAIATLHEVIVNCPIHYADFEERLRAGKGYLLEAQEKVALDGDIKAEAELMNQAIQGANHSLHTFAELTKQLTSYQRHIEQAKVQLVENEKWVIQKEQELLNWKTTYAYLPQLSDSESAIDRSKEQLAQLKSASKKDWDGPNGLIHVMAALHQQLQQLIDEFTAFDEAKDELSAQQNTIAQKQEELSTLRNNYPSLPDLTAAWNNVEQYQQELKLALTNSDAPNWFEMREKAQGVLDAQDVLVRQFEAFQVAEQEYVQLKNELELKNATIANLEEKATQSWINHTNGMEELSAQLTGQNYYELIETAQALVVKQEHYIDYIKGQLKHKEYTNEMMESISSLVQKANELHRHPYLFVSIPALQEPIPSFEKDFQTLNTTLSAYRKKLKKAVSSAKSEIKRQMKAKKEVERYENKFRKALEELSKLSYDRHAINVRISKPTWPHLTGPFTKQEDEAEKAYEHARKKVKQLQEHIDRKYYLERKAKDRIRRAEERRREEAEERRRREEERSTNSSASYSFYSDDDYADSDSEYDATEEDSGFSGSFDSEEEDDW